MYSATASANRRTALLRPGVDFKVMTLTRYPQLGMSRSYSGVTRRIDPGHSGRSRYSLIVCSRLSAYDKGVRFGGNFSIVLRQCAD